MSASYSDDYVFDLRDEILDLKASLTAEKARGDRLEKALSGYRKYHQALIADGRFNALYQLEDALGDSNG